jgi:BMFP domain-containing protein YqiC
MEKNNDFLRNIAKMVEAGLISSRDLKKEVENVLKIKLEEILGKLNLVSRDEFEIQKKIIEKLRREIVAPKKRKKKLIKKVKKVRKF